ncbi:MAG TPA: Uma2 family endonuclease [Chthonomonadaceae bacterium]|nr:Uma2 family endonuclease [Chthonomonadaceae bacterium]
MSAVTIPYEQPLSEDTGVYLRPWKPEEFAQAQTLGWFGSDPVELIEGIVVNRGTGKPWEWTRERFYEAAKLGWFFCERVERIKGEVYRKVTQNPPHFSTIRRVGKVLERYFGTDFDVRPQGPFPLPSDGDPEPDLLVARGQFEDFESRHPDVSESILVIEVSDTTLYYDKRHKAALYAEAGIVEYWIVNLTNRTLEVRRSPSLLPHGWDYANLTVYTATQSVTVLLHSSVTVSVASILPPASTLNS